MAEHSAQGAIYDYSHSHYVVHGNVLYEKSQMAPAGTRDYFQLLVTTNEVTLRFWKISNNPSGRIPPTETTSTHADFEHDEQLRNDVRRLFDVETLDYVDKVIRGLLDYLPRLEDKFLSKITLMLNLEDIAALSCTCQRMREFCKSDDLWATLYKMNSVSEVTDEHRLLADEHGWKQLFFTNKLQLQMQLRRKARGRISPMRSSPRSPTRPHAGERGDPAFFVTDPDTPMEAAQGRSPDRSPERSPPYHSSDDESQEDYNQN